MTEKTYRVRKIIDVNVTAKDTRQALSKAEAEVDHKLDTLDLEWFNVDTQAYSAEQAKQKGTV